MGFSPTGVEHVDPDACTPRLPGMTSARCRNDPARHGVAQQGRRLVRPLGARQRAPTRRLADKHTPRSGPGTTRSSPSATLTTSPRPRPGPRRTSLRSDALRRVNFLSASSEAAPCRPPARTWARQLLLSGDGPRPRDACRSQLRHEPPSQGTRAGRRPMSLPERDPASTTRAASAFRHLPVRTSCSADGRMLPPPPTMSMVGSRRSASDAARPGPPPAREAEHDASHHDRRPRDPTSTT